MGSENLHHKRKQRTRDSLKRKISKRESYDVVLIVCEGEKSEPNYLNALCDELTLNGANIRVLGLGTDPLRIVEHALKEFNATKDFDRVYCVFDKDQHPRYQDALVKVRALRERVKNPIPIFAITSVPCFEYWLLLHFTDSTRPYHKTGSKSAGEQLISELKSHIKDYSKGYKSIFEKTKAHLKVAIDRAKRISEEQAKIDTDNPSTNFYELAEYLMSIKKQ